MQAMSSVFTNKYSEGYPGHRYYGGQENVDDVELLAINRAKELFGVEHVNVQPYSGSPANHAVFMALLELGDMFMGLDLSCGGHLTHGSPVNFSGMQYHLVPYFVDKETGRLDMDAIRKIAEKEHPKMIISSLTAYPRMLPFDEFSEIAKDVDAYSFADISHIAGLIVGGVHPSPCKVADVTTTTHSQESTGSTWSHNHVQGRGPVSRPISLRYQEESGSSHRQRCFPRSTRRSPRSYHRCEGGGVQGGYAARVQGLRWADREERQGFG